MALRGVFNTSMVCFVSAGVGRSDSNVMPWIKQQAWENFICSKEPFMRKVE
jgi:hypothetical protein